MAKNDFAAEAQRLLKQMERHELELAKNRQLIVELEAVIKLSIKRVKDSGRLFKKK